MRTTAQNGELALLLEVASTPKPGNVDRHREYPDLRFEHFLAGAVGARPGFERAADGDPIGAAFEQAIEGMARQEGGNTQFGAVLLVTPLVRTAGTGELTRERAGDLAAAAGVDDAANFYRAFEHVDVAVDDPPEGMDALDVRRGSDAVDTVRQRGVTLADVMGRSADRDGVAAEWIAGFPRTFDAAERLLEGEGPVTDRAASVYLELLAEKPDTFVATKQDSETAAEVTRRAQAVLDGEESAVALADELVDRGVNPGTTADITAGALFVALERGLAV